MTPTKLFISYRSTDSEKVEKIINELASFRDEDGNLLYKTWQDKHNLVSANYWWNAITDAIIDCQIFVFFMSPDSLVSPVCLAELNYARQRNRPIIPVALEGDYQKNEKTGKYEIDFPGLVPKSLMDRQFLFDKEDNFYTKFKDTVALSISNPPLDINVRAPIAPGNQGQFETNHELYSAACDLAYHLAFVDANKFFFQLARREDADYANEAAEWIEILALYKDLIKISTDKNLEYKFNSKWKMYLGKFPQPFIPESGIFDPKNLAPAHDELPSDYDPIPPVKPRSEDDDDPPPPSIKPVSFEDTILPLPFLWTAIPEQDYSLSKYPITNAEYKLFLEEDGYRNKQWWTTIGWETKSEKKWKEPQFWQDEKFNHNYQPVVGISWFEAMAFCAWLSEGRGSHIMLPSETQWQYAAQGDDGRDYPWGSEWDSARCQNSVEGIVGSARKTAPVTQFDPQADVSSFSGDGRSPFGLVDMAGNVLEWCLTDYDSDSNEVEIASNRRVLRGGSWFYSNKDNFRCDFRNSLNPASRTSMLGFRLCLT